MPQPSGAVHSIWWLGLFFFDLFSHSGLRAFFTSDFANCTTNYAPTIRCCPQHLMVGVNFFLTCSPILDLGNFSQVILPIVLQIMPQPSGAVHSIWWLGLFFFDLFSHSGHRAFFTIIRCCPQHLMVGVIFFLTCSPILDLGHFSQVILPIVLQIMPQPSGAVHSIWWLGLFFFWPVLPFWT